MRKIILFVILLSVILLPSCSREEEREHNEKQKQQFYMQSTDDQKLKKEFFDLQLETAESLLKENLKIVNANETENEEKDVKNFQQEIYNSVENKYLYYIDTAGQWNLPEFNKNGKLLLFEIKAQYNFELGYRVNDEYIAMFRRNNNIIVNKFNIGNGIYYINMDDMYFLPDIEQDDVAKNIANRSKTSMFCKIEIQDEHTLKFYDKICEERIKEMLNMTSVDKNNR